MPQVYVSVLSRFYKDQSANVKCDVASQSVAINKGTKQDDPISPIMFNAVRDQVMRTVNKENIDGNLGTSKFREWVLPPKGNF